MYEEQERSFAWAVIAFPGWSDLIHEAKQIVEKGGYQLYQIKEKFGALRVYFGGPEKDYGVCYPTNDEESFDAMMKIESRSSKTCMTCGEPGRTDGWGHRWVYTLCDTCGEKRRNEK